MKYLIQFSSVIIIFISFNLITAHSQDINWTNLSTKTGDLQVPNEGHEQTSALILDIDLDGVNDFVITERSKAPSVVWYRKLDKGWDKYIIELNPLHIEAGSDFLDIDGDGDLDIEAGGDWQSNEVWWWENPYPDFSSNITWKRHIIKNFGKNKHHDQMFGDFDGDGKPELVFWNQDALSLYLSEIPDNPRATEGWNCRVIYSWSNDSQMEQLGSYPDFKGINEHEGLSKADIDGDGILDIIGGGRWFKMQSDGSFQENIIDAGYCFSRCAAGQLIKDGRPEVVLVVGDGVAPMLLYEWKNGTWKSKNILSEVEGGHSLKLLDFDGDGNLDIWNAEMRLNDTNPDAKNRILLGDGKGNFSEIIISDGICLHESKIADLDGDGDYDILGKPYSWDTPRLDVWLQNGTGSVIAKRANSFNLPAGLALYSLRQEFEKDIPGAMKIVKDFGFKDVEISNTFGKSPEEFRKILKTNGLKTNSMIADYNMLLNDMPSVIKDAKTLGVKYIGCGWIPHDFGKFGINDTNKAISDFNRFGKELNTAGFKFFYHPHGYEFRDYENGNLLDVMMSGTDKKLVTYELDLFWVIYSGYDPLTLLKKYPGRFELIHLKDLLSGTAGNFNGTAPEETSVVLGTGEILFPAFMREAVKQGIKYYYIEDESADAVMQINGSLKFFESLH